MFQCIFQQLGLRKRPNLWILHRRGIWKLSVQIAIQILGMLQSCASCNLFLCKFLPTDKHILFVLQIKHLMKIYNTFIFNTCKKIITKPNMVQSWWNFGYSFNIHFPTFVEFNLRLYTPSSKQKKSLILLCFLLRNMPKHLGVNVTHWDTWDDRLRLSMERREYSRAY